MSESVWKKEIRIGRKKPTTVAIPVRPTLDAREVQGFRLDRKPAVRMPEVVANPPVDVPRSARELGAVGGAEVPVELPVIEMKPPEDAWVAEFDVSPTSVNEDTLELADLEAELVPDTTVVEPAPLVSEPVDSWASFASEPAEPEPVPDTPVTAEKVPLLKRELSFRRAPKAAKPAKQKKAKEKQVKEKRAKKTAAVEAAAAVVVAAEKAEKTDKHKVTRVVGLRIGASQLSAAHVRNNGSAELVQLAREPLEHGLVIGGEVRDPEGLTRAVKSFFADNKLPRKDVRLGIASNRIGVRILEVPAIDDPKQFENALRFRAQELLPIPIVDAILDHVVLDEWTNDEGEALRRVLLVFAHRELVNRYVDVCRGAGVRLVGIDLDPFALLRAITAPRPEGSEPGDAVVAVSVGHDRTIVAVSDGRLCDFTRVLEWGGGSLDVAIARALNLTPSQAEPIKHSLDLDSDELPEGISAVQLAAVKEAVTTEIGVLGRELVSSLRFYQSRPGSLALGEIVLAGGTAHLAGLPAELQRTLGARVRVADPFARVVVGKKLTPPPDAASLAIAVGLGIED